MLGHGKFRSLGLIERNGERFRAAMLLCGKRLRRRKRARSPARRKVEGRTAA
jgi:hypothetical protein